MVSCPGRPVARRPAQRRGYFETTTRPPFRGTSSTQVWPAGTVSLPVDVRNEMVESRVLRQVPRTTRPPWNSRAGPVPVNFVSGTGLPAGSS
jgi:hypothetical protein